MATQAEIEAAIEAILAAEAVAAQGKLSIRTYATLVLDAAESVRPRRKDSTVTARSRRFRARRNGVAQSNGVAGESGGSNGVAGDSCNAVASEAMLLTCLRVAAGGNVHRPQSTPARSPSSSSKAATSTSTSYPRSMTCSPIRSSRRSRGGTYRGSPPRLRAGGTSGQATLPRRQPEPLPCGSRPRRPAAAGLLRRPASTWTSSWPATGPGTWTGCRSVRAAARLAGVQGRRRGAQGERVRMRRRSRMKGAPAEWRVRYTPNSG